MAKREAITMDEAQVGDLIYMTASAIQFRVASIEGDQMILRYVKNDKPIRMTVNRMKILVRETN